MIQPAGSQVTSGVEWNLQTQQRTHSPAQQSGGDSVTLSAEGRAKAREMQQNGQAEQGEKTGAEGRTPADAATARMDALSEDKDDIVKDLQDTESDIRAVKDSIQQARNSPGLSEEERERQVQKLENRLDRLEDEVSDMESKLSADE